MQEKSMIVEALDVGCGTGVYTEEIARNSQMCVGLDLSENMIRYAKRKRGMLDLILADAHKLPFRNEYFRLVASVAFLNMFKKTLF
jgi:ubiquinone/menaquinone biosynthesis C-methylase UbiE